MSTWTAIIATAAEGLTAFLVAALVVVGALVRLLAPEERRRLLGTGILVVLHLVLLPVAGGLRGADSDVYKDVQLVMVVLGAVAFIRLALILVFGLALPRIGMQAPRILREIIGAAASVVAVFALASRAGFNLSGIIATSAVLTAVIGLSLQDTLGNVMAGVALQLDHSVQVGDWIKIGDLTGRVSEVRWRSTRIETRNWETIVLPNSQLVRSAYIVLGKRSGVPRQWRRWVYFNIDFRTQPTDVIAAVEGALCGVTIANVAAEPPPNCILMELHDSYCRYAVRYWLTDLAVDDPTDSVVRTRVYFALQRAGMALSIPAHALFVTQDTRERKAEKVHADLDRRMAALRRVDFFDHLADGDRERLASSLHYTPYAPGEIMTRQGAEGHWLYMILDGESAVRVEGTGGLEHEVARLGPGTFFGEMSLMTGAPRSATVVALTDVECYRLDKAAFQELVKTRPELAERVAEVLARRQVGLAVARENLGAAEHERRLAADKHDLLSRIRSFFGLQS